MTAEDDSTTAVSLGDRRDLAVHDGRRILQGRLPCPGARGRLYSPHRPRRSLHASRGRRDRACRLRADRPLAHDRSVRMSRSCGRDSRAMAALPPSRNHTRVTLDGKLRLIDVATGRVGVESPWADLWSGCTFDFAPDGRRPGRRRPSTTQAAALGFQPAGAARTLERSQEGSLGPGVLTRRPHPRIIKRRCIRSNSGMSPPAWSK